MRILRRFLLTLSYVTSLPIKVKTTAGETDHSAFEYERSLAGLSKYLPAAGVTVGLILAGIFALLVFKLYAPHMVTAAIILTAWLCVTGGLHFDGLMDAADGVFSHRNKERMLEIMMDSRVGNFGAMTGLCVLLIKFAAIASLCAQPILMLVLLVVTPAWARWCELYAIGRFPYARLEGKGKIWHDSTRTPGDLFLGLLAPVAVSVAGAMVVGLMPIIQASAFAIIAGLVASHWLASHIDGHTGDTYGAVVELSEAGCLLLAAIIL